MPEHMVTTSTTGSVSKPVEGESSRQMPNQVGNVAGATMDELADRLIETSGRGFMPGPLKKVIVIWMSGMGCDGCTIATLGATEPSVEELMTGALPGIPTMVLHHYAASIESGDHFTRSMEEAEKGELDAPYVVVYEGSIADENLTVYGEPWAAEGALPLWSQEEHRRRISTAEWLRRLAPGAAAVIAIGTCATWGGIPASAGNPTGAMSVMDFLGKEYRSSYGLPVINVPGCAPLGDNFTETVALLLLFLNQQAPLPEFDELGRPAWLFKETVHRHCPRAGYYEEGTFASEYGGKECLVEVGCWGPVVNCNITERGAVGHMGGCMVAGGPCIGCTMPGFPDKFTPFYKTPPGSNLSTNASRLLGSFVRPLRRLSQHERNREQRWHDHVPSGWAMEYNTTTLTHKVLEYFYHKFQYWRAEEPGRQEAVEKYRSGYVVPAEAAYGENYQVLPEKRKKLAQKRGAPWRSGLMPQADGFDTPLEEPLKEK
ncbi:MAG: hydrogenase expression protein HypE [Chloroflexota bacterium]|nr:hydrogenase expression protein HypE [Chloroflexota bacterium]